MSAQVRRHACADVQLRIYLDKIKGDNLGALRNRIQSVAQFGIGHAVGFGCV